MRCANDNAAETQTGAEGDEKTGGEYGDALVCVRYRYDRTTCMWAKTVEIIVEKKAWMPPQISENMQPSRYLMEIMMNRNIFLVILISCLITSSLFFETVAGESKPEDKLTTIRYVFEPFRTFKIEGTSLKGVKLDDLTNELRKYKSLHQDAVFELWSEVKVTPEESAKIIEAIQSAGINLKHFWAPRSFVDPKANIGPYGSAHEDILKR